MNLCLMAVLLKRLETAYNDLRVRVLGYFSMLSCVIPTVGRQTLITRTLPSVFNQTYPPDEVIIVVDDPDNFEVVNKMLAIGTFRSQNIRTIEGDGAGGLAARLIGAEAASYPVVVFLDDDDSLCESLFLEVNAYFSDPSNCNSILLPSVYRIWSGTDVAWVLNALEGAFQLMRSKSNSNVEIPKTFSGLAVPKAHANAASVPKVSCYQDLLFIRALVEQGVVVSHGFSTVFFHQSLGARRISSSLEKRLPVLKELLRSGTITQSEYLIISRSDFFSWARCVCNNGSFFHCFNKVFLSARVSFAWHSLLHPRLALEISVCFTLFIVNLLRGNRVVM